MCTKRPIILLQGGPGAGKGTQSSKLAEKFHFIHLSAGDLLRDEVKRGSDKGKCFAEWIAAGQLVPIDDLLWLFTSAIRKNEHEASGFVIDGFPRDLQQAAAFNAEIGEPNLIIHLKCSEKVMKKRLIERKRDDDYEEIIAKRLATYETFTIPLINFFDEQLRHRSVFHVVDVETQSIDDTFNELNNLVETYVINK